MIFKIIFISLYLFFSFNFLIAQELSEDRSYYETSAGFSADYENVTANAIFVSGFITPLHSKSDDPENPQSVPPLYIPQEARVADELLKPYSSKAHQDLSNYISIKPSEIRFNYDDSQFLGSGVFFYDALSGLILNKENNPIGLRSPGSIAIRAGYNLTDTSSSKEGSKIVLSTPKIFLKKLIFKQGNHNGSIYAAPNKSLWIKTQDYLISPRNLNLDGGFIVENTTGETLMSVRGGTGAIHIKGDLDIKGQYLDPYTEQPIPRGIIIAYAEDNLPSANNWLPCNGSNNEAPNMTNLFFKGCAKGLPSSLNLPQGGAYSHSHSLSPSGNITLQTNHPSQPNCYIPLRGFNGVSSLSRDFTHVYNHGFAYTHHFAYVVLLNPDHFNYLKRPLFYGWYTIPFGHRHFLAQNELIKFFLPSQNMSVALDSSQNPHLFSDSSGVENQLPSFAKLLFLMKT
ncbi:hypothetical protein AB834_05115 [PVC group bacterium (ex Bugula neritina AB1)]|nr:hypothetical protein AB834_05115 [PVC group bacterium (ex Bugula neritina AB1)]